MALRVFHMPHRHGFFFSERRRLPVVHLSSSSSSARNYQGSSGGGGGGRGGGGAMAAVADETSSCWLQKEQRKKPPAEQRRPPPVEQRRLPAEEQRRLPVFVSVPVVSEENSIGRTATILAGSLLLFLSLGLSKAAMPAFAQKVASPPLPSTTTTAAASTAVSSSLQEEEEKAQNLEEQEKRDIPLSAAAATETQTSSDVGGGGAAAAQQQQQNITTTPEDDNGKVLEFQTDPAELVLLRFLERHPEDVKALEGLMYVQLRKGDVKAALKVLEKLLELRPDHLPWQLIRAQSLDFVGDLDGAHQAFESILEKNPLSARALQGLAIVMSKMGEEKELLEMLKKAVDAALKAEKPKEAINVRMLLAQMHTMQGNLKEALGEYQDVVKVDPNDFRPYLCQGLVYSILGKTEEAEKQFSKYRQLCPNTFPNRGYLDDLLLNAKTMARKLESCKEKKPAPGKRPMKPMRQPTAVGVGAPPPDSK